MVYTLHRYILQELLRVFILALVALTLILSLGSILQPVQEYGAGPRQVLYFMFYFLPITLTFVLPMAALFAGTLVYGRFTSDNEFDACRASGISVLTLVLPGLLLAIIVAIANLLLSFYVMPVFVHLAEKSLKADAKQMLFRSIEKKGFYDVPSEKNYQYLIYADQTDPRNDTLYGVIATKVKGNKIEEIITAQRAQIKFITRDNINEVQITVYKTNRIGKGGEVTGDILPITQEFGSILGDDIKFKTIDEMKKIEINLMQFEPIAQLTYDTYDQLIIELLANDIRKKTTESADLNETNSGNVERPNNYYEIPGEPNSVKFSLSNCNVDDNQVVLSGEIEVIEIGPDEKPLHTYKCKEATLRLEGDKLLPTISMDLSNTREIESGQTRMWHTIENLNLPQTIEATANQFKTENGSINCEKLSSKLTELAGFQPGPTLTNLQRGLHREILKTRVEIKSEIHSRLVFGFGCISMILIGIGLGIIKKGGHPLSAFGVSCIPAAVLIVCIMSGKQLTENLSAKTVSGVTIMWAGLAFLCLLTVAIYSYLLKN